ncbi:MAG: DUF362 domain-containing protein [Pseudomonadota bacterium]
MASKVWFSPARGTPEKNRLQQIDELLARVRLADRFGEGDLVAIKTHWGEAGNTAFVPSFFVRRVVRAVRKTGARPFVTDTNTLYRERRHDAVDNLRTAAANGFTAETLGCPLVIADGLVGTDGRDVIVPGAVHGSTARIASAIVESQGMVVVSHVKGHMVFGFGGALKNLGMGCCTTSAKQRLHADVRPMVEVDLCTGCATCVAHCRFGAIAMERTADGTLARIDHGVCSGCGECVVVCPVEAIPIRWDGDPGRTQEKTAEVARAAVLGKETRTVYLNFLTAVTPDCDCCSWSDASLIPDVGVLASSDPVAVDMASLDLIREAAGGRDVFRERRDIDPMPLLRHAAGLGLGSIEYRLERLD